MRPQQQGRRRNNRGGNNNRNRNQNPLQRSYESNGPDVKIRGNPQTIADKYTQLARDAQSSGDTVMAENYYQHAEHYMRIIMAAQPPQQQRDENDQAENAETQVENSEKETVEASASGDDQEARGNRGRNRNNRNRNRDQNDPKSEEVVQQEQPSADNEVAAEPANAKAEAKPTDVDGSSEPAPAKKPRAARKPRTPREPVVTSETIEPEPVASGEAAE